PDAPMSLTLEADLVVVGGGLSGLSAATRASQLGLRTCLLEQSEDAQYLCNSRMTNGIFHMALKSAAAPPEVIERAIEAASRGAAHKGLQQALATDSLRAVRWLQA